MADLPAVIPLQHRHYTLTYLLAAAFMGLVLGVLITWAFFTDTPSRIETSTIEIPNLDLSGTATTSRTSGGTSSLSVPDQPAGTTVVIDRADVAEGQWVVIHEERLGGLGNVLGAARFIGDAKAGAVELLRGTRADALYYVVIYADNGDGSFSLEDDTPLRDASGTIKSVTFKAR